jgi:cytochrome c oxidase cbb3-type subunit 1
MYGIITFLLWACIYAVVPRLTGREPPQATVGAHFWMALIGLLFYSIPLMLGGTLRGIAWLDGVPFVDTLSLMAPFWLWRAIGGTLMWLSHWNVCLQHVQDDRRPRCRAVRNGRSGELI